MGKPTSAKKSSPRKHVYSVLMNRYKLTTEEIKAGIELLNSSEDKKNFPNIKSLWERLTQNDNDHSQPFYPQHLLWSVGSNKIDFSEKDNRQKLYKLLNEFPRLVTFFMRECLSEQATQEFDTFEKVEYKSKRNQDRINEGYKRIISVFAPHHQELYLHCPKFFRYPPTYANYAILDFFQQVALEQPNIDLIVNFMSEIPNNKLSDFLEEEAPKLDLVKKQRLFRALIHAQKDISLILPLFVEKRDYQIITTAINGNSVGLYIAKHFDRFAKCLVGLGVGAEALAALVGALQHFSDPHVAESLDHIVARNLVYTMARLAHAVEQEPAAGIGYVTTNPSKKGRKFLKTFLKKTHNQQNFIDSVLGALNGSTPEGDAGEAHADDDADENVRLLPEKNTFVPDGVPAGGMIPADVLSDRFMLDELLVRHRRFRKKQYPVDSAIIEQIKRSKYCPYALSQVLALDPRFETLMDFKVEKRIQDNRNIQEIITPFFDTSRWKTVRKLSAPKALAYFSAGEDGAVTHGSLNEVRASMVASVVTWEKMSGDPVRYKPVFKHLNWRRRFPRNLFKTTKLKEDQIESFCKGQLFFLVKHHYGPNDPKAMLKFVLDDANREVVQSFFTKYEQKVALTEIHAELNRRRNESLQTICDAICYHASPSELVQLVTQYSAVRSYIEKVPFYRKRFIAGIVPAFEGFMKGESSLDFVETLFNKIDENTVVLFEECFTAMRRMKQPEFSMATLSIKRLTHVINQHTAPYFIGFVRQVLDLQVASHQQEDLSLLHCAVIETFIGNVALRKRFFDKVTSADIQRYPKLFVGYFNTYLDKNHSDSRSTDGGDAGDDNASDASNPETSLLTADVVQKFFGIKDDNIYTLLSRIQGEEPELVEKLFDQLSDQAVADNVKYFGGYFLTPAHLDRLTCTRLERLVSSEQGILHVAVLNGACQQNIGVVGTLLSGQLSVETVEAVINIMSYLDAYIETVTQDDQYVVADTTLLKLFRSTYVRTSQLEASVNSDGKTVKRSVPMHPSVAIIDDLKRRPQLVVQLLNMKEITVEEISSNIDFFKSIFDDAHAVQQLKKEAVAKLMQASDDFCVRFRGLEELSQVYTDAIALLVTGELLHTFSYITVEDVLALLGNEKSVQSLSTENLLYILDKNGVSDVEDEISIVTRTMLASPLCLSKLDNNEANSDFNWDKHIEQILINAMENEAIANVIIAGVGTSNKLSACVKARIESLLLDFVEDKDFSDDRRIFMAGLFLNDQIRKSLFPKFDRNKASDVRMRWQLMLDYCLDHYSAADNRLLICIQSDETLAIDLYCLILGRLREGIAVPGDLVVAIDHYQTCHAAIYDPKQPLNRALFASVDQLDPKPSITAEEGVKIAQDWQDACLPQNLMSVLTASGSLRLLQCNSGNRKSKSKSKEDGGHAALIMKFFVEDPAVKASRLPLEPGLNQQQVLPNTNREKRGPDDSKQKRKLKSKGLIQ